MRTTIILFFIFTSFCALAQSEWQNYSAIDNIQELEVFENTAYVPNAGGLLVIDLGSGEEELLMPSNSTLEGAVSEIEFLSNGHAWLVCYGELFYFDGNTYEAYEEPESVELVRPKKLKVVDDALWFQDFHGEIYSIIDDVITDHSELLPKNIKHFDIDSNGNLWAVNKTDIYHYDGSNILSQTDIYPGDEIFRLDGFYVDSEDRLWISIIAKSTSDFELIHIDQQDRRVYKSSFIKSFFEHDSLGVCFSSSRTGFRYIEENELTFLRFDSLFTDLPGNNTSSAVLRKWGDNDVWFTGSNLVNPMIHRYADNTIYKYGYNDDFLGEILDMNSDCNDVLFKSGESTLEKFEGDQWEAVYPDYTDDDCTIYHLEKNPFTCELWGYGRPNGNNGCNTIWKFDEDNVMEMHNLDFGIVSLAFGPDDMIYVIGSDRNINRIDASGNIQTIEVDSVLMFTDIFVSSEGIIWLLGTDYSNPCNIKQTFFAGDGIGEWVAYSQDSTDIRTGSDCIIFEDDNGDLWFESVIGLVQFDGSEWTSYPMDLGPIGFNEVLKDELGNFWISTYNAGLAHWDRENLVFYTPQNSSIFSTQCLSLERVGNDIWIEHPFGISQMKINGISSTETENIAEIAPNFTLFPNPTSGSFNVKSEGSFEKRFDVYNIKGELILTEFSNQNEWNSNLKSGVYLIKMTTKNGEHVEKLIVL